MYSDQLPSPSSGLKEQALNENVPYRDNPTISFLSYFGQYSISYIYIRPGEPRLLPSSGRSSAQYQNVIDNEDENSDNVDYDEEDVDDGDVGDDEDKNGDEDEPPPCTAWSTREVRQSS